MLPRTHLVLVPGFGGFDVLGQMLYYVGVREQFAEWRDGRDVAIHFFDNLPTAAVKTRAKKLARFVDKLVARNIIAPADRIVLVGHSTGGLDIRQLVRDVRGTKLLSQIKRLVFLSVPQRGTNIADWVRGHDGMRRFLVAALRRGVGLETMFRLQPAVQAVLHAINRDDTALLLAVADADRDMIPSDPDDGLAVADALAAASEIKLWLADTDADFLAIEDLSVAGATERVIDDPEADVDLWTDRGIHTLSYVTHGACPFDDVATMSARVAEPRGLRDIGAALRSGRAGTDGVYRAAYAACAGGPFASASMTLPALGGGTVTLEAWDNDGIVNSLSERPLDGDGGACVVVPGDHADIIGHYKLSPDEHSTRPHTERQWDGYDLLRSNSGFTDATFAAVWRGIFDFAIGQIS